MLALWLVVMAGWVAGVLVGGLVMLFTALGIVKEARNQARGTLTISGTFPACLAQWQTSQQRPGPDCSVQCDYLGPWLIGLRVAGRRIWLWPDSAPAEQRRVLRRWLRYP
ncbi:hypothetical protein DU506_12960 [Vreelandella rituensis]|uniref:Uncharacterized protein n=1 Tax=Vreelandella rituensis TaxID=2282306 RepID=A0A368TXU1_9GAMM|nr:hypothetical protein DU506_12960 [Halomonas rituensis]